MANNGMKRLSYIYLLLIFFFVAFETTNQPERKVD